jgi:predicted 3-demethylubiquinone-9 3-methyltransferase (glyoxalase superfamily)
MSKISPCLWFTNQAAEAANFYVSLLPDSRIDRVTRSTVDLPSGPAGSVLLVSFTLAGQAFLALNGGVPQDHTHPSRSPSIVPIRRRSIGCGTACPTVARRCNAVG